MSQQPNIIILISDQHRYDCTGFSEMYPVKTPYIDQLAAEGVWFEQAYCTTPTCCPARQSFISGKRPERFGALWNYDLTLKIPDLPTSEFSFARALKEVGYQTAYVGKWHVSNRSPLEFGFDRWFDSGHAIECMWAKGYKNNWECYGHLGYIGHLGGPSNTPYEEAAPHILASKALEMLQEMKENDRPICMVLSIEEPHLPCCPSEPFSSMFSDVPKWRAFEDTLENKPYIQRQMLRNWTLDQLGWDEWSKCAVNYYGIIAQVDDAMGRVLNYIRESGDDEDTVIIYTSDHGDMCGNRRMLDKHYVMYDDVVHVPFIIKWKNHYAPRKCSDFVHNFLDLHSTILEISGAKGDDICDGRSLVEQLNGKDTGIEYAFSTFNGAQFGLYTMRMIRCEDYKYVWNTVDVDEFYDLKNDPDELCNEIHNPVYQDIITDMRRKLYEELKRSGDELANGPCAFVQLLNGNKI